MAQGKMGLRPRQRTGKLGFRPLPSAEIAKVFNFFFIKFFAACGPRQRPLCRGSCLPSAKKNFFWIFESNFFGTNYIVLNTILKISTNFIFFIYFLNLFQFVVIFPLL